MGWRLRIRIGVFWCLAMGVVGIQFSVGGWSACCSDR